VAHFWRIENPLDFWGLPVGARTLMKAYAWAVADMRAVEAYEREQEAEKRKAEAQAHAPRGRKRSR